MPINHRLCQKTGVKKSARRRRKHCALAVVRWSQKFLPDADPLPRAHDDQNLISWLYLQTQFGEDQCMQFQVIMVTDPPTHKHPQTDRTDYNTLRRS